MDGNTKWKGDYGSCYAFGAMGIEDLIDEDRDEDMERYLDEVQAAREQNPEEQAKYEAWLEDMAKQMFGDAA